ncbi:MAG: hypothetical protein OEL91_09675, partial [Burkholderiaceae bacterium]|nr:hypothetical protein [Burkholderiaceae bacterium]
GALLKAVHSELTALARRDPLRRLKLLNGLENTTAAILKLIAPQSPDRSPVRSHGTRPDTQTPAKEYTWFPHALTANAH